MKQVEKLTELLDAVSETSAYTEDIAGALQEAGVFVVPAPVGAEVWVLVKTNGRIYKNVVVDYIIRSRDVNKSTVRLRYVSPDGAEEIRKFRVGQFGSPGEAGAVIFLSEDDALDALGALEVL